MTPDTNRKKPLMLITGSSGLVGTRLTGAFADEFRVIGLDLKEPQELVEDPPGELPPLAGLADRAGSIVKHADDDPQWP